MFIVEVYLNKHHYGIEKEASGLRLLHRLFHTQEVRVSNPLPTTALFRIYQRQPSNFLTILCRYSLF